MTTYFFDGALRAIRGRTRCWKEMWSCRRTPTYSAKYPRSQNTHSPQYTYSTGNSHSRRLCANGIDRHNILFSSHSIERRLARQLISKMKDALSDVDTTRRAIHISSTIRLYWLIYAKGLANVGPCCNQVEVTALSSQLVTFQIMILLSMLSKGNVMISEHLSFIFVHYQLLQPCSSFRPSCNGGRTRGR